MGYSMNESDVNKFVENIIKGMGFQEECVIKMENEGNYGAAYFLPTAGKNYYIWDIDKKRVIKHGVATKSTSMAKIIDRSTDSIVEEMLTGEINWKNKKLLSEIDNAYDTSKWRIVDIAKSIHLRRPDAYKKGNPIGLTIGKLSKKRWKIPDADIEGMQVLYIKLRGKSNYAVVDVNDNIDDFAWDKTYYLDMLDQLLSNLGLSDFHPKNRNVVRTVQKNIWDV